MKRSLPLVLVFSLLFAACGDDSGTPDATPPVGALEDAMPEDAMSEDAMSEDAMSEDAMSEDAMPEDAMPDGSSVDAPPEDATAEGGSSCPRMIPDGVGGVCDGRGMAACRMWAQENGGPTAAARCVPPEGRCARADACDGSDCTCGGGPECGDDQMCVSGFAGFTCVCLPEE